MTLVANLLPVSTTPEVPPVACLPDVADFPAVFLYHAVVGVSDVAGIYAVARILLLLTSFLFLVFLLFLVSLCCSHPFYFLHLILLLAFGCCEGSAVVDFCSVPGVSTLLASTLLRRHAAIGFLDPAVVNIPFDPIGN
jgi:hypothetical protein